MLTIGSMCSGIDGLALGLEWAGLGPTLWHVEKEPFCRRILTKQWPLAEMHDDVHEVEAQQLARPDLICFGFPCQDLSSAGRRAGLAGSRSVLFYRCADLAAAIDPDWIVVENVASGATNWVDACCRELVQRGYAPSPFPLRAADFGALHQRARVFIIAHADRARVAQRAEPRHAKVACASAADAQALAHADRVGRSTRLRECKPNARGLTELERDDRDLAAGFPGWRVPEPRVVRVVHGLSQGLDQARSRARGPAALQDPAETLDAQRRRALGNAVVPQMAEAIGRIILRLLGTPPLF